MMTMIDNDDNLFGCDDDNDHHLRNDDVRCVDHCWLCTLYAAQRNTIAAPASTMSTVYESSSPKQRSMNLLPPSNVV
jgi:hypothetical protein